MKKIYFLMGALAVSMLSACHNHDHEEKHTHGTEETAREDNHEEHADESILTDGKIDPKKLKPISYDPVNNTYLAMGDKVGNAFKDGLKLK